MSEDYTSFHPGERMSKEKLAAAEESRRRYANFAPGVRPGPVDNSPPQIMNWNCYGNWTDHEGQKHPCNQKFSTYEAYISHHCNIIQPLPAEAYSI